MSHNIAQFEVINFVIAKRDRRKLYSIQDRTGIKVHILPIPDQPDLFRCLVFPPFKLSQASTYQPKAWLISYGQFYQALNSDIQCIISIFDQKVSFESDALKQARFKKAI